MHIRQYTMAALFGVCLACSACQRPQEREELPAQREQTKDTPPAMCQHLDEKEQAFAQKLRAYNRTVFCQEMTEEQRKRAMHSSGHGDYPYGRGRFYTPDASVEHHSGQSRPVGKNYQRSCR